MSEPVRQLDIGPRKPQPSTPIEGSARARVQAQAERMLPGIGSLEAERLEVRKPCPVRGAWGEAASSLGFALALTLRSKALKWTVRVVALVLWFTLPVTLSGLLTLLMMAWCIVGVASWVKRLSHSKKGVDKCQCGH